MHALLLATLVVLGQAHFSEKGGATHANRQGSTTRHPMGDDSNDEHHHYPHYEQVPIIGDCVGDMRGEPTRCICRKQYGFRKAVCAEGQQCFRGDGTCLDFQTVTCSYDGGADTKSLAAYYTGTYVGWQNDDAGRDDAEPGKKTFAQPVPVMGRSSGRTSRSRLSFTFSFTDRGPDYDLIFDLSGDSCAADDIIDDIVCSTASGPWRDGLVLAAKNSHAEIDAFESTEEDVLSLLDMNRSRGRWTHIQKIACQSTDWIAMSYNPYKEDSAVTCNVVDDVGLGEIGCGAMRDAGVDCCYNNVRGECGYDRRCKFDGGLFVLSNDDWEVEVFGNPERNHLNDMSEHLIAGRAKVPTGSRVVAMTHSHGDDAIDHEHTVRDDGVIDGEDGENDDGDDAAQEDGDNARRL